MLYLVYNLLFVYINRGHMFNNNHQFHKSNMVLESISFSLFFLPPPKLLFLFLRGLPLFSLFVYTVQICFSYYFFFFLSFSKKKMVFDSTAEHTSIFNDQDPQSTFLSVNMTIVTKLTNLNHLMWNRQVRALLEGH